MSISVQTSVRVLTLPLKNIELGPYIPSFLLEDGFFILLEDGNKILLEA